MNVVRSHLVSMHKNPRRMLTEPAKAGRVTKSHYQAELDAQPIVAHMLMHEHQHKSWLWQTKLADAVEISWQVHSR